MLGCSQLGPSCLTFILHSYGKCEAKPRLIRCFLNIFELLEGKKLEDLSENASGLENFMRGRARS